MRTYAITFLAIFGLFLTSCNTDDDTNLPLNQIPNEVNLAFRTQFPNAVDVEYNKIGTQYKVDFEIDLTDYEAIFNEDGTMVKYKYDILTAEVPQTILTTIDADYGNRVIDDSEILNIGDMTYYQIELDNFPTDDRIVFNEDGTVNTTITFWE